MLLINAKCGDKIEIKEFLGKDAILKKIEAMGLRKGDIFEIVKKWGRNFLLKSGNNRIVLSAEIAKNIKIELIERDFSDCEERSCWKRWRWFK